MTFTDEHAATIVRAWNLMGGEVAWNAIDTVCEMLAYDDPDRLVQGLCHIRDIQRKKDK